MGFVDEVVETYLGYDARRSVEVIKYVFAKEFGFRPKDVEEMDVREVKAFLKLLEVDNKLRKEVSRRWR